MFKAHFYSRRLSTGSRWGTTMMVMFGCGFIACWTLDN